MNGRSSAIGKCSSDHCIATASGAPRRQAAQPVLALRRDEAQLGAERQVAVDDARAERLGELLPVAGGRRVDAFDLGLLHAHETRLQLRAVGEVAGSEDDAAA